MRRESATTFRPRDSGGGGPLELAQRANRGGGGAGRAASVSEQKDHRDGAASFMRKERASLMSAHDGHFRTALSPAPPPPPLRGGPPPPLSRGRMEIAAIAGQQQAPDGRRARCR